MSGYTGTRVCGACSRGDHSSHNNAGVAWDGSARGLDAFDCKVVLDAENQCLCRATWPRLADFVGRSVIVRNGGHAGRVGRVRAAIGGRFVSVALEAFNAPVTNDLAFSWDEVELIA